MSLPFTVVREKHRTCSAFLSGEVRWVRAPHGAATGPGPTAHQQPACSAQARLRAQGVRAPVPVGALRPARGHGRRPLAGHDWGSEGRMLCPIKPSRDVKKSSEKRVRNESLGLVRASKAQNAQSFSSMLRRFWATSRAQPGVPSMQFPTTCARHFGSSSLDVLRFGHVAGSANILHRGDSSQEPVPWHVGREVRLKRLRACGVLCGLLLELGHGHRALLRGAGRKIRVALQDLGHHRML